MGQLIYLKDVVTLALDEEKCVGCGICLIVCPHAVLGMNNGNAGIENRDLCMECGACAKNCPTEALSVQAGVGCAEVIIRTALGRDSSSCSCAIEPEENQGDQVNTPKETSKSSGCC